MNANADIHSKFSTASTFHKDHGAVLAQQELFIRLGNMDELQADGNFVALMNLGNAVIDGDLQAIQNALAYYTEKAQLIYEHIDFLSLALANSEVRFQEPTVLKCQTGIGQNKNVVMISMMLERVGKIVFISSDQNVSSEVHAFVSGQNGIITMEAVPEDPRLLLKQISRIIRLPEVVEPPPLTII